MTAPTVGPWRGLMTRPRTTSPRHPSTATAAIPWATTRSGPRSGSTLYVPPRPFRVGFVGDGGAWARWRVLAGCCALCASVCTRCRIPRNNTLRCSWHALLRLWARFPRWVRFPDVESRRGAGQPGSHPPGHRCLGRTLGMEPAWPRVPRPCRRVNVDSRGIFIHCAPRGGARPSGLTARARARALVSGLLPCQAAL